MLIDLPMPLVIALNIGIWPAIHFGLGWLATRMPAGVVRAAGRCLPLLPGETPRGYERFLGIRRWKDALPDAGAWFSGGRTKSTLIRRSAQMRAEMTLETCRSEAAHWLMGLASCMNILWNPPWAIATMAAAAVALNLPCILVQRYNRLRVAKQGLGPRPHS
jgi:glycosyl-4,4'-diaponeurosporenoate acyltransferase